MPSFDLVSTMDIGELKNALNMATKQISGRYDFKGSKCAIEMRNDAELKITGDTEYQVQAALEILYQSMGKRNLGIKGLEPQDVAPTGNQLYKQEIIIHNGIDKNKAKTINKLIKDSKFKVSSQYLDEKIRVTGKKIDDLQGVFQMLKNHKDVNIALAMENMK
ncbi:MAG: YajQ family cyclic di-GMP-binding protein [Halobacteriovoraceae bacterium]|jgi:cyclic-di-GMP-binding protein|nr:YajQ family cyclic di-GMP-binding protein [Halobacteriovoraceae bacterium]